MAKLWQFSRGHSKPAFFEKVQSGDQGKFFKNRPKKKTSFERQKSTLAQIVLCCNYYALKILALPNPEFKILADFKILAFQNRKFKILALQKPEFKIMAHLKILPFQNPEFKILAQLKISNILNLRFWPISRF